ncbi:hypothetical protein BT63DRAFT_456967 [Microthyrium microscopicum]|uniref:Uncharacterized protein n=1 Tax=Microthyrium microscopicum TaxID=703497 RepID=A0A6A6U8B0_9PEZI|nr:hypothetical protein BT63DRAFT_456967 [Microthyrium microscopicum]
MDSSNAATSLANVLSILSMVLLSTYFGDTSLKAMQTSMIFTVWYFDKIAFLAFLPPICVHSPDPNWDLSSTCYTLPVSVYSILLLNYNTWSQAATYLPLDMHKTFLIWCGLVSNNIQETESLAAQ